MQPSVLILLLAIQGGSSVTTTTVAPSTSTAGETTSTMAATTTTTAAATTTTTAAATTATTAAATTATTAAATTATTTAATTATTAGATTATTTAATTATTTAGTTAATTTAATTTAAPTTTAAGTTTALSNQCSSSDQALWHNDNGAFYDIFHGCATDAQGQAAGTDACIQGNYTSLTNNCVGCFGQLVTCVAANCVITNPSSNCSSDFFASTCQSCVTTYCASAEATCIGSSNVPMPAGSGSGAIGLLQGLFASGAVLIAVLAMAL